VIFDLVTVKFLLSYSTRPLQMFGPLGLLLGAASPRQARPEADRREALALVRKRLATRPGPKP